MFNFLNKKDKNKLSRKNKEQIGDKIITKSSYEAMSEKEQAELDSTCPECGKHHTFSGGFITDGTYNYHTCHYCKCQWKIRKK